MWVKTPAGFPGWGIRVTAAGADAREDRKRVCHGRRAALAGQAGASSGKRAPDDRREVVFSSQQLMVCFFRKNSGAEGKGPLLWIMQLKRLVPGCGNPNHSTRRLLYVDYNTPLCFCFFDCFGNYLQSSIVVF